VKRWIPHLVHLFTIAAVVLVCIWVAYQRRLPPAPLARKIAEAERLSYQVVTRSQGPKFEILGNEQIIKIVSHAVLDPDLDYDPRRSVSYGFHLKIIDDGRLVWQHDALLDSRQSKKAALAEIWMQENAFTSRLDTELSDDRMLLVHLPEDVPAGSTLEMTLFGEPEKALIRVYKHTERDEASLHRILRRIDELGGKAALMRNTFTPWSLLSEEDKLERLSHNFERMAPMGEGGTDFHSQSVFYTGFRSAAEDLEAERGLVLERHRGLVLNVLGPTAVRVELRRARGPAAASRPDGADDGEIVRVRTVSAAVEDAKVPARAQQPTDESLRWELAVPGSERPETHALDVPAGLHSLHFFTDARTPVRLDVSGPPMSQFGAIPYLGHDEVERRLVPDERRMVVFETGPDKVPAILGIFVPDDPRARILRADVRILVTPDPPGVADTPPLSSSRFKSTVTIAYLDRNERVLATEQQDVEAFYTPFERMERTDGSVVSLSDPVGMRMIAPAGTQWVKLTASRDVAVRFYRHLDGEEAYQAPYSEASLARSVWRYAPRDRRQWFYAAPSNASALLDAVQRAVLVAQVRLEPMGGTAGGMAGGTDGSRRGGAVVPAVSIAPLGRPAQHVIFEPVLPRRFSHLLARWPVGVSTRMLAQQAMRFRFDGRTRPRLDYRVPAAHLGKTLTLRVDGAPVATMRVTTTRGYWRLPRVASGDHAVDIVTEASGMELYLDRPPAPIAAGGPARFELLRRRTVYALGPESLEVEVHKPAGKRVSLTMVLYAPWPEARDDVQVRAVIGAGVPQRITRAAFPRITVADRTLPMPAAESELPAIFADREDSQAGYPRFITVPLGDDLVPGNHRVGFSLSGSSRLWARFFVTHQTPTPTEEALQWYVNVDEAPFSGAVPEDEAVSGPDIESQSGPGIEQDRAPAQRPDGPAQRSTPGAIAPARPLSERTGIPATRAQPP
jgi:hypothetical protein